MEEKDGVKLSQICVGCPFYRAPHDTGAKSICELCYKAGTAAERRD